MTYTYPEAAHVGLTADAAQKLGYRTKVAVNHFSHSAKGYALGYEEGLMTMGSLNWSLMLIREKS
ncbi:hypothetical protein M5E89_13505 [Acidaminococcus intestini]|nr:hypothetical protein M5E89_13505 [Acidaminococcus intestini]